jgi:hypothetical protein
MKTTFCEEPNFILFHHVQHGKPCTLVALPVCMGKANVDSRKSMKPSKIPVRNLAEFIKSARTPTKPKLTVSTRRDWLGSASG